MREGIRRGRANPGSLRESLGEFAMITEPFRQVLGDLDADKFETFVVGAVRLGSSDVHFEPLRRDLRVRVRVEGHLREVARLPHPPGRGKPHPLVVQMKARASLQLQSRKAEDGRIDLEVEGRSLSLRVATMPQVHGEKIVLRIFDVTRIEDLGGLGFRDLNLSRLKSLGERKAGILLLTGPTGSGKTTTLYALLNHLNDPGVNLITVEDPVEYYFEGINQIQVEAGGMGFHSAMRAILRHDPDILMVGEIRDRETAEMAFHAAATGHLVLSTVHARDAVGALMRLLDLGVPPLIMAQAINGVVAQRLVPALCARCAVLRPHPPLEEVPMAEPGGCPECLGTGIAGRQGIQEVLILSDTLRKMASEQMIEDEFRMVALKEGMETLKEDAIFKSIQGRVHYRDALGITDESLDRIHANLRRMVRELRAAR